MPGLIPVKTVRGAMGQRYAIAALSTQGPATGWTTPTLRRTRSGPADDRTAGRRDRRRRAGRSGARRPAWRALGQPVVVLERSTALAAGGPVACSRRRPRSSALRRIGLDAALLREVARPIPAMRVETPGGATFRLTYGADAGGEPAVGFDRSRLDPALLELAAAAGAEIRRGWAVTAVDLDDGRARRPTARRDAGDASPPRSSSAPTGRIRSWRRPPAWPARHASIRGSG